MTTAHDIVMNYRAYLAQTFGAEGWVFEAQMPRMFHVSDLADNTVMVRANGSDNALGLLEKACELYAVASKKIIDFNGMRYVPLHEHYAGLAA